VLYVARYLPYLPADGSLTRTFHLVRAASEVASVSLVGASHDPMNPRLDLVQHFCEQIHLLDSRLDSTPRTLSRLAGVARKLESRYPLARPLGYAASWARGQRQKRSVMRYLERSGTGVVADLLSDGLYDLVVVEHSELAGMLVDVVRAWGGRCVADLHRVMWLAHLAESNAPSERALVRELEETERRIVASYTRVTVTSAAEAARLEPLVPGTQVDVVPNGVDIGYFGAVRTMQGALEPAPTVIFTGLLSFEPNVDALRFFAADVWPLIRQRRPGTRFLVVGGGPVPTEVEVLASQPGIRLFVSVDDVRPFLASSTVAVAPLRIGGGTRVKVLEALAAGLPVVSTTLGAEGLDLTPERDLLLADAADEFARSVLKLLDSRTQAQELAAHGGDMVRRLYSWDNIRAEFGALLRQVLRAQASARGDGSSEEPGRSRGSASF